MKYSEGNKPLSHHIHKLMYKKMDEISKLQAKPIILYDKVNKKRKELRDLEEKFIRQVAWEKEHNEN